MLLGVVAALVGERFFRGVSLGLRMRTRNVRLEVVRWAAWCAGNGLAAAANGADLNGSRELVVAPSPEACADGELGVSDWVTITAVKAIAATEAIANATGPFRRTSGIRRSVARNGVGGRPDRRRGVIAPINREINAAIDRRLAGVTVRPPRPAPSASGARNGFRWTASSECEPAGNGSGIGRVRDGAAALIARELLVGRSGCGQHVGGDQQRSCDALRRV